MQRLYLKIYVAVIAAIALFALLAGLSWKYFNAEAQLSGSSRWQLQLIRSVSAQMFEEDLALSVAQSRLDKLHADTRLDFGLYGPNNERILFAGTTLPLQMPNHLRDAMNERRRHRDQDLMAPQRGLEGTPIGTPMFAINLTAGRALLVAGYGPRRPPGGPFGPGPLGFISILLLIAAGIGAGSYPVIRKLTKQLETLRTAVDRFGQGDLAVRAPVQGQDEVAALALSFNTSAQRIEQQIAAQRSLLANASHELRSPLARLKMALALGDNGVEAQRNIAELDDLIEEILLASRLEAAQGTQALKLAPTDIAGLAAEECARTEAQFSLIGDANSDWMLSIDAKLIRRVLRNLLENARRYAPDTHADCSINTDSKALTITIEDRGPGVEPSLRERIFEPFYRLPGASEKTGGVGLGLSLCRQIVRHHGGQIVCVSRDGGGSRFIVTLPR